MLHGDRKHFDKIKRYIKGHHRSHTFGVVGKLLAGVGLTNPGRSRLLAVSLREGGFQGGDRHPL